MSSNIFNLVSEEVFSEKLDALAEAVRGLNNDVEDEPDPAPTPDPSVPEVLYDTKGLEYVTRNVTIDSSQDWSYTYTLNKKHFILSIPDQCVAVSTNIDNWKTESIIADFNFSDLNTCELICSEDRVIILENDSTNVYTSTDGITWTKIEDALPATFATHNRSITYFKNRFIAATNREIQFTGAGYNTYCMISDDGITWSGKNISLKWAPPIMDYEDAPKMPSGIPLGIAALNDELFITLTGIGLFKISEDLSTATVLSEKTLIMANYFDHQYLAFEYSVDRYDDDYYALYSTSDLLNWVDENTVFNYTIPKFMTNSKCSMLRGEQGDYTRCYIYSAVKKRWEFASDISTYNTFVSVVGDTFIQASCYDPWEPEIHTMAVSEDCRVWLSGKVDYLEQEDINVTKEVQKLLSDERLYFTSREITRQSAPPSPCFCYGKIINEAGEPVQRIVSVQSDYCSINICYSDDDGVTWISADIQSIIDYLEDYNGPSSEVDMGRWTNICYTGSCFVALQAEASSAFYTRVISPCLAISMDGSTWDIVTTFLSGAEDEWRRSWSAICPINGGLMAVGYDGTISQSIARLIKFNNGANHLAGVTVSDTTIEGTFDLRKVIPIAGGNRYVCAIGDNMSVILDTTDDEVQIIAYRELPISNCIDAISDHNHIYAIGTDGGLAVLSAYDELGLYIHNDWELVTTPLTDALSLAWIHMPIYNFEDNETYIEDRPCIVHSKGIYVFNTWSSYGEILDSRLPDTDTSYYEAYIYQALDDNIYYYGYTGDSYGNRDAYAAYASADYGKSWVTKITNLIQGETRVTEPVADALWSPLESKVLNSIAAETSKHLVLESLGSLDETDSNTFYDNYASGFIYNKTLNRFAISKDSNTVWYSDDNMSTWKVHNLTYYSGIVVGAIGNAFILKDEGYVGNSLARITFTASTLEENSAVSCVYYDQNGNRRQLPVANYSFALGKYNGTDRLIMYGSNIVAYSTNGSEWYVIEDTFPLSSATIKYTNGKWVAVSIPNGSGNYTVDGLFVYQSDDGITWTSAVLDQFKPTFAYDLYPRSYELTNNNDCFFLCVYYAYYPEWVEGGPAYAHYLYKSQDGSIWESYEARDAENNNLGAKSPGNFINDRFIDISNQLCSYDGVQWFIDESLPILEPPTAQQRSSNTMIYADTNFALIKCAIVSSSNSYNPHQYRSVLYKTLDGYSWSRCAPPTVVYENSNNTNIIPSLATMVYSNIINTLTLTLMPSNWADNKYIHTNLPMIDSQSIIFVSANAKTQLQYINSQIQCIEQGRGYIAFECLGTEPTEKVLVDLLIIQPTSPTGIASTTQIYNPRDYE